MLNHLTFPILIEIIGNDSPVCKGIVDVNFIVNELEIKMKSHKHTKSLRVFCKPKTELVLTSTPLTKTQPSLPLIRSHHHKLNKHIHSLSTQPNESYEQNPELKIEERNEIAELIQEKSAFLRKLRDRVDECNDHIFWNKIVSEIQCCKQGEVLVEIWKNGERYEKCTSEDLKKLEVMFETEIGLELVKGLEYVSDMSRFMLADYKNKTLRRKEKDISSHKLSIHKKVSSLHKKMTYTENSPTKAGLITSLSSIKTECSAQKQHYLDWRERALEKLRNGKINCQILRAEIFMENLF